MQELYREKIVAVCQTFSTCSMQLQLCTSDRAPASALQATLYQMGHFLFLAQGRRMTSSSEHKAAIYCSGTALSSVQSMIALTLEFPMWLAWLGIALAHEANGYCNAIHKPFELETTCLRADVPSCCQSHSCVGRHIRVDLVTRRQIHSNSRPLPGCDISDLFPVICIQMAN